MWVMKLRLETGEQFLGQMAVKHGVSMTGYPLSYYKDKHWLYLFAAGFMFGEEKNKKALVRDMKKQDRLVEFESSGDFIILVVKQPLVVEPAYDSRIIKPSPMIINKEGYHIWELASFDRDILVKALKALESYLEVKVLKFKEEKLSNMSITTALPELTKNQKKALEVAINAGYYNYPKKVGLVELAKKMGISYSTYQAHLKKAEGKLLPEVYKEL